MKVLIIDDAEDIVQIIKFVLIKQGHEVFVAGSGAEALARVKANEPELIFVDYHLQDMLGPDIVAAIYADLKKAIPSVLVTGESGLEPLISQMGFSALVMKPFSAEDIRQVMVKFA